MTAPTRSPKSDGDTQVTRRALLSWLGNATVLALSPEILAACGGGDPPARSGAVGPAGGTAGGGGGGVGSAAAGGSTGAGGSAGTSTGGSAGASALETSFPFDPSPVEGALYDPWRGNTVDPQQLVDLLSSWQLRVDGLVERPRTLSFADLVALPRQDQVTDFHCVEGWSVYDVPWNGVHIDTLIALVAPLPSASHITLRCFGDVYSESIPLTVAREPRTLMAYGIDGKTIPETHGFPLRLVVPRLYGYKSAKWVQRIEFASEPLAGYWEQGGYTYEAEVPVSRLREGKY